MTRTSRFVVTVLLLAGSALSDLQAATVVNSGSQPGTDKLAQSVKMKRKVKMMRKSAGKSFDARKYWDRCINGMCPSMDEMDARKK